MWRQVRLLTGCGAGVWGEQHLKPVPLRNPEAPTLCLQSYLFIFQVLTFVVLYLFRRVCDLQSLIASMLSCVIVLVQQLSSKFLALDDLNALPSIMFGSWVARTSWGKSLYLDLCPLLPSLKWTNKESSRVVFISTYLQSAQSLILAFFTFFKPLIHSHHLLSYHGLATCFRNNNGAVGVEFHGLSSKSIPSSVTGKEIVFTLRQIPIPGLWILSALSFLRTSIISKCLAKGSFLLAFTNAQR